MSAPRVSIVEGWTGALPFTLLSDGSPVNLAGMTVAIVLKNSAGTIVKNTTTGVTVTLSTGGQVEYAPTSDLFTAAQTPFSLRFRVTDSTGGALVYFPNDEADLIEVNPL